MEAKFVQDTAVRQVEAGVFEGTVSRDWWIERGPNGGYLAAMLMRALTAAVGDDERSPRSLTIHFTAAPAEGPIAIATTIERAGRSLTTVTARMEQDGRLVALAIGAFSTARSRAVEFDDTARPDAPAPEATAPIEPSPHLPRFTTQWELRPALGGRAFRGEEALMGGWIRPVEPQEIDAALVAQLTDAWIPAVFRRLEAPNPVPTVDLTIHFRAQLPLPADWVLARFASRLARDGFVEEDGELWSRDGVLIAQSRQLALLQAPSQR